MTDQPQTPAPKKTKQQHGEEERVATRIGLLRGLLVALEKEIEDPAPPGVGVALAVAHAASDLATYVARLDATRRLLENAGPASFDRATPPSFNLAEELRRTALRAQHAVLLTLGSDAFLPSTLVDRLAKTYPTWKLSDQLAVVILLELEALGAVYEENGLWKRSRKGAQIIDLLDGTLPRDLDRELLDLLAEHDERSAKLLAYYSLAVPVLLYSGAALTTRSLVEMLAEKSPDVWNRDRSSDLLEVIELLKKLGLVEEEARPADRRTGKEAQATLYKRSLLGTRALLKSPAPPCPFCGASCTWDLTRAHKKRWACYACASRAPDLALLRPET